MSDKAMIIENLKTEIKKVFNKEPKVIESSGVSVVMKLHVDEVTTTEIVAMDRLFLEYVCNFTLKRSGTGISILVFC